MFIFAATFLKVKTRLANDHPAIRICLGGG